MDLHVKGKKKITGEQMWCALEAAALMVRGPEKGGGVKVSSACGEQWELGHPVQAVSGCTVCRDFRSSNRLTRGRLLAIISTPGQPTKQGQGKHTPASGRPWSDRQPMLCTVSTNKYSLKD